MPPFKFKFKKPSGILTIWKVVIDLLVARPFILLPFGLLVAVETLTLYILASSPHFPVNILLAPVIRNKWGEIYLHYPFIYELLPRMFYYAKMVVGIFIGCVTTGMAVYMVSLAQKKQEASLKIILVSVLKHYVSLFLLTAILFICVHFLMKQPSVLLYKYFRTHPQLLFWEPKFWFNNFLPVAGFFIAVLLQGLFVYSIPYIVLKGKKFLAALILGIRLFFKIAGRTLLVVIVPMLLYIPVTMLRSNTALLADKYNPEVVILVLFLGILVGTLIVDFLVTTATTLLFIKATHED